MYRDSIASVDPEDAQSNSRNLPEPPKVWEADENEDFEDSADDIEYNIDNDLEVVKNRNLFEGGDDEVEDSDREVKMPQIEDVDESNYGDHAQMGGTMKGNALGPAGSPSQTPPIGFFSNIPQRDASRTTYQTKKKTVMIAEEVEVIDNHNRV